MSSGRAKSQLVVYWRYVYSGLVIWTLLIAGSLIWNYDLLQTQKDQLIHNEAIANFNKDQAFRMWGTMHGGISRDRFCASGSAE